MKGYFVICCGRIQKEAWKDGMKTKEELVLSLVVMLSLNSSMNMILISSVELIKLLMMGISSLPENN